ncbi:TetR/AcrR family transcriptional regulator [Streptoalloteichus hindustanus]|uniref:Transcriptional regulator, TetR family n=1 Tax=Streptoalloteichus hindustanus TaxID=2017 RepID=A0A1M4ZCZ6_STRHI|nr:TetR/AcrR family transcriptional regulator [Streptoalloteichus hindustanus]SHF15652.1 transcriptional regulator, TetR family [Streptoalloteichus hindustanus]
MVIYAGQGDVRRSMALLWRAPGSPEVRAPGPRPGLSVDLIVETAIAVADAEGMAGLSMRAVGERLGRTAMALYTYVPNKNELLDLMHDRALAELPTDYDLSAGWRPAATAWADALWSFYLRHPWVLQVSQARPVLGPNEYVVLETLLRVLFETGLPSAAVRRLVGTLFHYVRGSAQTVAESRHAPATTGVSDEDWWRARASLLLEVAPDFAERFPMVARLEGESSPEPPADADEPYLERETRRTFEFGLSVILDGVEAAIARANA